ncbi:sensor histidine kinase [Mycobacterium sp. NPDC003449]
MALVVHPTSPPLWLGIVVAAVFIAAETLLVFALRRMAPENTFGALFLFGVLVVSAGWGLGLAVTTTLASALAYIHFHLAAAGGLLPIEEQDVIAVLIFLPVALLANALAGHARSRAAEADQRRREAEALAGQQVALRRVATLVAHAVSPAEVFTAVAQELARCLGAQHSALARFESDGTAVVVAAYDEPGLTQTRVGSRFSFHGASVAAMVSRTGAPARQDDYGSAPGADAQYILDLGLRSGAGAPIAVGGRIWGAAFVGSSGPAPLPPGTEYRVDDFAGLVATAIANAAARVEITASRARIVTAADTARRRFERDLHDGAQQRLVSLGLELRLAESSVPDGHHELSERLSGIVRGLNGVSEELREISRGIHPAILSRGGLGPALKALGRRSVVPAVVDVDVTGRFPESVEVGAYYVVAESLTNVAKHAKASGVRVRVHPDGPHLRLSITDDGIGGADPARGSGLIGLRDRVEALGGTLEMSSPAGRGTVLTATIPVDADGAVSG